MINASIAAANTALIQDLYAAFGRGDLLPTLAAAADPAIEWESYGRREEFPVAGMHRGMKGLQDFFGTLAETVDFSEFTPKEFVAADDKVVALGHYTMKVKKNGREIACNWVHAYTIRDGKVLSFREYTDTALFAAAYR